MRIPSNATIVVSVLATASCAHRGTLPTESAVFFKVADSCPPFELSVHEDGTVDFRGSEFASRPGPWGKRVSPEAAARLRQLVTGLRFTPVPEPRYAEARIGCRVALGNPNIFMLVHEESGWSAACGMWGSPIERVEHSVLDALGARDWAQPTKHCVAE